MLTSRFAAAVALASEAHATQRRKGTSTPYIAHPLAVAALVLEFGGDEEQAIAALLHDVLEDAGPAYAAPILAQFGERVLTMVEGCTDAVPDQAGVKPPWRARKVAYLEHLAHTPAEALLISACDKLHNARAILDDLRDPAIGKAVFKRFKPTPAEMLWYYGELSRIFTERQCPVAARLSGAVEELGRLVD
ncbi:MAG: HD domain-containing protein [Bryobacteraceae bacterium]|nr:HD domain-containing protein [Bryobacteraceae bacterium]